MELEILRKADAEVAKYIELELKRQRETIELIASENYVSKEILKLQGSVLTNKYAEGYPGKKYYGGCEHIDTIEKLNDAGTTDFLTQILEEKEKQAWMIRSNNV